ncbi:MAG: AAA family ATPase [Leptospiraceae bacterium]|nr:AAA family ATPase [Leptospiraceae bacterium]
MRASIIPGVIRGLGRARIEFNLVSKNKKVFRDTSKKILFLEKLDLKDKEFSKTALFKTLKFFTEPNPDEVLFWTVLKLIYAQEIGGICVQKKEILEFILSKNPKLDPEKSWKIYFDSNKEKLLLTQDADMIYLTHLYKTEISVCNFLNNFLNTKFKNKFKEYKDETLSEEQLHIVNSIFNNSISFLSGGPGTGKTTIIQAILKSGITNGIDPSEISILAPTGKAAKRLQESCILILNQFTSLEKPRTIHRFLGYNPSSGKFKFNADNLITKKLIIVDESSMLDIYILKAILEAYPNIEGDKRLIFVGDPDQLLSVNSGSVFSDFVRFNVNSFKLSKSFRQTLEGEEIKSIANKIKNLSSENNMNLLVESISPSKEIKPSFEGVHFLETTKEENSVDFAWEWYNKMQIQGLSGQILTPYNETKIGVKNLNLYIEKKVNTSVDNIKMPVIVNNNLYDIELFNGESGYLEETSDNLKFTPIKQNELIIPKSYRSYFEPAFAITVHKSQGSEYDHVCLVIPAELESPDSLLNIRIIYTAITRAKKSVTIIGSFPLFQKALLNKGEERHSRIVERLSSFFREQK